MAKVENLQKVLDALRSKAARAAKSANASVLVGYTAAYAIFVHENMEVHAGEPRRSGLGVYWGPAGAGPKFLEAPAREMKSEIADIVKQAVKAKKTVAQGLVLAGLRLQRESMKRVPREYGNLVNSAFTRLERGETGE